MRLPTKTEWLLAAQVVLVAGAALAFLGFMGIIWIGRGDILVQTGMLLACAAAFCGMMGVKWE